MCTSTPLREALQLDEACRGAGAAFIRADTRGVFASVFCDFGPAFTVLDVDGARKTLHIRSCHPKETLSCSACAWNLLAGTWSASRVAFADCDIVLPLHQEATAQHACGSICCGRTGHHGPTQRWPQ